VTRPSRQFTFTIDVIFAHLDHLLSEAIVLDIIGFGIADLSCLRLIPIIHR
jgi:hypothetical protein